MAASGAEALCRATCCRAKPAVMPPKPKAHGEASGPMSPMKTAVLFGGGALLFLLIGRFAPPSFLGHFTVFVLACFVG